LIAVFVVIGLVAAIVGTWWTAITSALLAAAQLASIAHERRLAVGQDSRTEP